MSDQKRRYEIATKVLKIVKEKLGVADEDVHTINMGINFDEELADDPKMLEIIDAIEKEFDICFNDDCNLEYVCQIHRLVSIIEDPTYVQLLHHPGGARIGLQDMKMVEESYLKKIAPKSAKAQRNLAKINAALAKNKLNDH